MRREDAYGVGRIDSLRAVACLLVAAYHMSAWVARPTAEAGSTAMLDRAIGAALVFAFNGHAAIFVLLVISGCVLSWSISRGPRSVAQATIRFTIARVFRIYPVTIAAVALYALYSDFIHAGPFGSWRSILRNAALLDVDLIPVMWTLQVEILGVPLILMLFFLGLRLGGLSLLAVASMATALSFSIGWLGYPPMSRYFFAIVWGMVVPWAGEVWARRLTPRQATNVAAVAFVALISAGSLFGTFSQWSSTVEALGATTLVALAVFRPEMREFRILDRSWLQSLGLATGSFYLLSPLVAEATRAALDAALPGLPGAAAGNALVGAGVIAAILLVTVPVAMVSYLLVERPGIALGRRLARSAARCLSADQVVFEK